jgi:hypothetical protein
MTADSVIGRNRPHFSNPVRVIGTQDLAEAQLHGELGLAHRERRRRQQQNADDHRDHHKKSTVGH